MVRESVETAARRDGRFAKVHFRIKGFGFRGVCRRSKCEDRVLDGPASGEQGSKSGPYNVYRAHPFSLRRVLDGSGPHSERVLV